MRRQGTLDSRRADEVTRPTHSGRVEPAATAAQSRPKAGPLLGPPSLGRTRPPAPVPPRDTERARIGEVGGIPAAALGRLRLR